MCHVFNIIHIVCWFHEGGREMPPWAYKKSVPNPLVMEMENDGFRIIIKAEGRRGTT